jgi:NPCBM/NEW2 domain
MNFARPREFAILNFQFAISVQPESQPERRAIIANWQLQIEKCKLKMDIMHYPRFIFLLFLAFGSSAHAGSLRTLDGKSYDGEIRLERPGYFLVVPKVGSLVRVEPANVIDAVLTSTKAPVLSHGVVLTDGTALSGTVDAITDDSVHLTCGGKPITVSMTNVARVLFAASSADQMAKVPADTSGLLLVNGDFYAGEFRGYERGSVKVESVLFGIATFPVGSKAIALILRDAAPAKGDLVVRLLDGSVLTGDRFEVDGTSLKMTAGLLGPITIDGKNLAEIHIGGDRMQSLADLQPQKVDGGEPQRVLAINATTVGLAPKLRGVDSDRAIGQSAGSSITYALEGKYKLFFSAVGVPMNAVPFTRAKFSVIVDGKPAITGTDQSSLDDALNISVKVTGAQSLTLKVESDSPVTVPGLWCNPVLLKADAH